MTRDSYGMTDRFYWAAVVLGLILTASSFTILGINISIVGVYYHRHASQDWSHPHHDTQSMPFEDVAGRSYISTLAIYITGSMTGLAILAILFFRRQDRLPPLRFAMSDVTRETSWPDLTASLMTVFIPAISISLVLSFWDNWHFQNVCQGSSLSVLCLNSKSVSLEQWLCADQQSNSNPRLFLGNATISYCVQARIVKWYVIPYIVNAATLFMVAILAKRKHDVIVASRAISHGSDPVNSRTTFLSKGNIHVSNNYGATLIRSQSDSKMIRSGSKHAFRSPLSRATSEIKRTSNQNYADSVSRSIHKNDATHKDTTLAASLDGERQESQNPDVYHRQYQLRGIFPGDPVEQPQIEVLSI